MSQINLIYNPYTFINLNDSNNPNKKVIPTKLWKLYKSCKNDDFIKLFDLFKDREYGLKTIKFGTEEIKNDFLNKKWYNVDYDVTKQIKTLLKNVSIPQNEEKEIECNNQYEISSEEAIDNIIGYDEGTN